MLVEDPFHVFLFGFEKRKMNQNNKFLDSAQAMSWKQSVYLKLHENRLFLRYL